MILQFDEIDSLKAAMFAQDRKNTKTNDDMQQVAIASNQQGGSGSIPKTSRIVSANNIYDNKQTLYQPTIGTWLLEAIEFRVTGGSGQYTHNVSFVHDNGAEMIVFHDVKDAADIVAIRSEIEIDENITVQVNSGGGGGTPTDVSAYAYLMRRR